MEKVVFRNSRNLNLIGNLYSSNSNSIVIMSHGFAGDKSERGRFDSVAKGLNKAGYNVLTFDFSGCGESDDDTLTVDKEVDDLRSSINFVKSKGLDKICLLGHSLGGLISLKCYSTDIDTIVLWSPITDKIRYTWDQKLTREQLQELEEKGYYTRPKIDSVRSIMHVDKQMLRDRENVNQAELLKNIACPILIISGGKDTSDSLVDSKNAIKLLSSESKLEIIEEADHFFFDHLDVIIELTTKWLTKYLL